MSVPKIISLHGAKGDPFAVVAPLPRWGQIGLTVHGGEGSMSYYFTPAEAREIAAELRDAADQMEQPRVLAKAA